MKKNNDGVYEFNFICPCGNTWTQTSVIEPIKLRSCCPTCGFAETHDFHGVTTTETQVVV